MQLIAAEGLACQRGGRIVVSGLSFEVQAGSALTLRGPNGSGKTTLLRTIAGFLPPAAGVIRVTRGSPRLPHPYTPPNGRSAGSVPSTREERDRTGGDAGDGVFHYFGHANGIKPRLSVIENVSFWQRYYSGGEDVEAAEASLDAFALLNLASFSAGHLSQGQARRLGLARLLAAYRPVWLLDEPSVSLDAASTKLLEKAIAGHLSAGGLAIISTHLDLALPNAPVLELVPPQFLQ
ncbi:MAG: heme ABC exporter ATP-binding protein CcmA [Rhodomicrobium sp.]|nr:heme ABC exporter ATP-binding protein CcmA [Rhodomicrobium sp.]